MDKDQFKNYLTIIFPKSNLRENEEGFDFVIRPTSLKKKRRTLDKDNVSNTLHRINSTDSYLGNTSNMFSSSSMLHSEFPLSSSSNIPGKRSHPEIKDFNDWITTTSIPEEMKNELNLYIPPNNRCTVYNPIPDGFCTIYAIFFDLDGKEHEKDFYIEKLYDAIKKYFETEENEQELTISVSEEFRTIDENSFSQNEKQRTKKILGQFISNNSVPIKINNAYKQEKKNSNLDLYTFLEHRFNQKMYPFDTNNRIMMPLNKFITLFPINFTDDEKLKTLSTLKQLENSNDLPIDIVKYFPYITRRNILFITYDINSENPMQKHNFTAGNTNRYTILINYDSHTYLICPYNLKEEQDVVQRILQHFPG
jgi:hypothetical protein